MQAGEADVPLSSTQQEAQQIMKKCTRKSLEILSSNTES